MSANRSGESRISGMEAKGGSWRRRLMIVPPVVMGALVLIAFARDKAAPVQIERAEIARPARVVEVAALPVAARATGFGTVRPDRMWVAIAQVGGIVVEIHPDLKRGALLPEGALLVRLDPADQELAISKIEAQRRSTEAQIRELDVRDDNLRQAVAIEREALAVTTQDVERKRNLSASGAGSQSALDLALNTMLAQRQRLQSQQSSLELIPTQRDQLRATAALQQSQLDEARLALERTEIRMPFTGRINDVSVERGQYAAPGIQLAGADGIDVAEVAAQVPLDRLRPLVTGLLGGGSVEPDRGLPRLDQLGLEAVVRLRTSTLSAEWPARFSRMGDGVDPKTRAVEVIVMVDKPYEKAVPGIRPPLTKGMFVEVELRAPPGPPVPVIPRAALQPGDHVHVAGPDDRLEIRRVKVADSQAGFAMIAEGLRAGERVVISDLIPAVDGMLLAPVRDTRAETGLASDAAAMPPIH
jgi:membrane fusion protein, multidrug efflux system